jgi:hypothetical protein
MKKNFGWYANVTTTDLLHRWQNVYFYQEREGGAHLITGWDETGDITYEVVPEGMEPVSRGLVLPYGCLDALAPILRPGPSEEVVAEIRRNLATEEARVDLLIGKALE